MEEILRCFIKDDQPDMNRQIEFIIKQLNSGMLNTNTRTEYMFNVSMDIIGVCRDFIHDYSTGYLVCFIVNNTQRIMIFLGYWFLVFYNIC